MSRNWSFTFNNYTADTESFFAQSDLFSYVIYGREVGAQGTRHLQGYFQLVTKKRLEYLVKRLPHGIHLEVSRGTAQQNITYCSKDGDVVTRGEPTHVGTTRPQLYTQINECSSWPEVLQLEGVDRHLAYAREVWANRPVVPMEDFEPRLWQAQLLEMLSQPPDDRTILWITDPDGGIGKSFLTKYLYCNRQAFVFSPAKGTDVMYAYHNETIVVYDIPRSADEAYCNWGVLEKLKDGILFSGKYESGTKYRSSNCHIVVFSNQAPPEGKFSQDRLKVYSVSTDGLDPSFV